VLNKIKLAPQITSLPTVQQTVQQKRHNYSHHHLYIY